MHWLAKEKPILKAHLENATYTAKYLSPDIHNELIELAGEEVLSQYCPMRGMRNGFLLWPMNVQTYQILSKWQSASGM